jgi:hypothetical protein
MTTTTYTDTAVPLTGTVPQDIGTTLNQIGWSTVAAISGLRYGRLGHDLILPVSSGYRVRVALTPSDTYTVTREMKRGDRVWVKGVMSPVYADQLSDVAYEASCYKSTTFGGHAPSGMRS